MKSSADFQTFYKASLLPVLETLEAERKKLIKPIYLFVLAVVVLILIQVVIAMVSDEPAVPVEVVTNQGPQPVSGGSISSGVFNTILLGAGVGALGYFFWFMPKRRGLRNRYKNDVIGGMVKFVDSSLTYQPQSGITRDEYIQSGIFTSGGDRYHCEDLVSGTLGSTAIRFSEVHCEEKHTTYRDGKHHTEYRTLFRGILFAADFNKHFKGRTVVLTDQAERTLGSLGTMFQKMNVMRDGLIKMDNVDFEKAFAVYGTDPVEANYILSPALMERILNFKQRSGNIQLSFSNANVYISIPVRENLFEPRIFSEMTESKSLERYFDFLQMITGIVEELNLNTRIWTKE